MRLAGLLGVSVGRSAGRWRVWFAQGSRALYEEGNPRIDYTPDLPTTLADQPWLAAPNCTKTCLFIQNSVTAQTAMSLSAFLPSVLRCGFTSCLAVVSLTKPTERCTGIDSHDCIVRNRIFMGGDHTRWLPEPGLWVCHRLRCKTRLRCVGGLSAIDNIGSALLICVRILIALHLLDWVHG